MRHSETLPISILDDSRIQSERSLVKDDVMFALDGDLEHRNPNPAIMSPSDRDMAYIETPRINLKKWAKSFKSCFFEQKFNNEFKFEAKFYFLDKFIFKETLDESKRAYSKSEKVFNLY